MTEERRDRETGGYAFTESTHARQQERSAGTTGNGATRSTDRESGGPTGASSQQGDAASTTDSDTDSSSGGGLPDRRKFTQRMPENLVEQIDDFAETHGMSRNAAINMLAKTGLDEFP